MHNQIVRKKSIFSWKLSKFSKYIGQGVPLPPSKKIFIADMDELEHAKKIKKVVKMSTFWDDNSQLFFFRMNPFLILNCKQV